MKPRVRSKSTTRGENQGFDVGKVRRDFPVLKERVHGKPLVYLDNAATTQKPLAVIEAVERFYRECNANVHRGEHFLSVKATQAYEASRESVRQFVNAAGAGEIIFTKGATESINLVAQSWGRKNVGAGDEVALTVMEHHSNIVPWQMLCDEKGAKLRVLPIDDRGQLRLGELDELFTDRTRILAVIHVSNALGTINPIADIVKMAHARGVLVLVDGTQAVTHQPVDVRALDCDFYAFSSHKCYGPTGVGVLYGKHHLLDAMPPWQTGGGMVSSVTFEKTTFNEPPHKFEAGTPPIAGVIGLGAALEYLSRLGLDNIAAHERDLLAYGTKKLLEIPGLKLIGSAEHKTAVLSFTLGNIRLQDIGAVLDGEGVAVRTGNHAAQPAMDHFGIPGTVRASLGLYNTRAEIDVLVRAIHRALEIHGGGSGGA